MTIAASTLTRNRNDIPRTGRLLGLDVGSKTIGLAITDAGQMIANPHSTLRRSKWTQDLEKLKSFVITEKIVGLVVGLPLEMTGNHGASADRAQEVARLLAEATGLPTLLWDERLSTVSAEAALMQQRTGRQTRASKKDIKQDVDAVAAALILQGIL